MDTLNEKTFVLNDSLCEEKQGFLYKYVLSAMEKPLIEYVLARTYGNQLKAAKILGVNRNTLRAKIKKLGINRQEYRRL